MLNLQLKIKLSALLSELKGFKFVITLVPEVKKLQSYHKTLYSSFYSKAERIINESDIDDVFEAIYGTVLSNIQKFLGQDSSWITDSDIDHNVNILKYNPLAGSSYIKLPEELSHSRKEFINIQNTYDIKRFKWCFVRYFYPADYHPAGNGIIDQLFGNQLDFEDIKFPAKIKDINKIEKKRIFSALVFLVMKIRKSIQSIV